MDKIIMNQMEFYGYHGVYRQENELGQRFLVDLIMETDLKQAGLTDDLVYTVDYSQAYTCVKEIMEGEPRKLVEKLGEEIADAILSKFEIVERVTVKIVKPNPPIHGHYRSVAVEMTRSR